MADQYNPGIWIVVVTDDQTRGEKWSYVCQDRERPIVLIEMDAMTLNTAYQPISFNGDN
jgi:hypothetical protein